MKRNRIPEVELFFDHIAGRSGYVADDGAFFPAAAY